MSEAFIYNCRPLESPDTGSMYSHVPVHIGTNNVAKKYAKTARSMSTCVPSSSYEALRYAVAALNRLDDFNCEKIGAGFFSEVFKVTHRTTGQVMVLKMNTSQSNRANMLREVQLMNRLSHENILRFMGVCVHEGQLHALTEYINGGSLEQLLQSKHIELTWESRIKLSLDIARGMTYLHSRGVFHRDLTSKNVLIKMEADDMTAVVGDFGLAEKIPDSRDRSQRLPIVGSPYWMAPECLKGAWYNEKADVFSFGIILCEIIARVEADPDILPRTENFGVDYVAFSDMCPDCPPQYLELAYTCCRIDPEGRPFFKEIVQQLEKMLNVISSMSGGSHLFYPPVVYTSCWDDGDNIDSVRAIFAQGWNRTNSTTKAQSRDVSPIKSTNCHPSQIPVTPKHVGEAMSMWDPHYKPYSSSHNPFASLPRFWKGKKFLDPSVSDSDLTHSVNLSPRDSPTPMETIHVSPFGRKSLSKSLPASPTLLRKCIWREDSPRSFSPGPSFSPPSSLSPFEPDDSFSGYSSVQEQMNDCKLEDDVRKMGPAVPQYESPSVVTFRTKTPSLCAKLRRSSGESGFFSVGDRNSTCDLSLESYQVSEDLQRNSCDLSMESSEDVPCEESMESSVLEDLAPWTSDGANLQLTHESNSLQSGVVGGRKRPSSCYSDDSCSCCGNHSPNCVEGECFETNKEKIKDLPVYQKPLVQSKTLLSNCIDAAYIDAVPCLKPGSCPKSSSHVGVVADKSTNGDQSMDSFRPNTVKSMVCEKGKRITKCMRKSCD